MEQDILICKFWGYLNYTSVSLWVACFSSCSSGVASAGGVGGSFSGGGGGFWRRRDRRRDRIAATDAWAPARAGVLSSSSNPRNSSSDSLCCDGGLLWPCCDILISHLQVIFFFSWETSIGFGRSHGLLTWLMDPIQDGVSPGKSRHVVTLRSVNRGGCARSHHLIDINYLKSFWTFLYLFGRN